MKFKLATVATIIAIVLIMLYFFQLATYSSRTGEDTPLYSVRRHDPYGVAALHDLLQERGVSVHTIEQPQLDSMDHGVLIQVLTNSESRTAELPTPQLIDWISQGNTVIQLARSPTALLQHVKTLPATQPSSFESKSIEDFETAGGSPDNMPATINEADTVVSGAPRLQLWSPMIFNDDQTPGWKPLARLSRDDASVVAGEIKIGRGKLVFIGAPNPALNGSIASEGNLDFLLSVIGNQPVFFDEWSHGIGHEPTIVRFLRDVGLLPVLFQIVLVAGLYVWSTSGYGPPAGKPVGRRRSSAEQIETLGLLYGRSLGAADTFHRVDQEVHRRLTTALRCQPKDLAARLATLKPELRTRVEQMLSQLNGLQAQQSINCHNCGYDLSFNESGRCPECGSPMTAEARRRLAEMRHGVESVDNSPPRRSTNARPEPRRLNAWLANLLSVSHQLTLEITRDRRAAR